MTIIAAIPHLSLPLPRAWIQRQTLLVLMAASSSSLSCLLQVLVRMAAASHPAPRQH